MDFTFTIHTGRSVLKFQAKLLQETTETQTIGVTLGERSIILENDLPYNRRMNLKRNIEWHLKSGRYGNVEIYLEMIDKLEKNLTKNYHFGSRRR